MELIVVAPKGRVAPSALERLTAHLPDSHRALLWLGTPEDQAAARQTTLADTRSVRVAEYANAAHARVREWLPEALHDYAHASGLMDLYRWRDHVSIWWFLPLPEMSPYRTQLIHELYRLALIAEVVRAERPATIHLLVDDELFATAAGAVGQMNGAEVRTTIQRHHRLRELTLKDVVRALPPGLYRAAALPLHLLRKLLLVLIVRCCGLGGYRQDRVDRVDASGLLLNFTWFPVHWQPDGTADRMTDRLLGDTLESFHGHGYHIVYIAMASFGWWSALKNRHRLRAALEVNRVVILESLLTLRDVLHVYLRPGWLPAYRRWRRSRPVVRLMFDRVDVTALLLREIDRDTYGFEVQTSLLVAMSMRCLIEQSGRVRGALHAFEYQPIERGFAAGIRQADGRIPIIGVQTGMASINQMGYLFPLGRTSESPPLPDFVAVYSTPIFTALAQRLGRERVRLTGDLRYPYLPRLKADGAGANSRRGEVRQRLAAQLGLDSQRVWVLAALPSDALQARRLFEMVVEVTAQRHDVAVLFRCHYMTPIDMATRRAASTAYAIANGDLPDLLLASHVVITGSSSVIVEAIVAGCMPIVYHPSNEYSASPGTDIPEAILEFETVDELREGLDECLKQGPEYQRRRERWAEAAEFMLNNADGRAQQRFGEFLGACVAEKRAVEAGVGT